MADPKFLQYVDDHKDDYINRLSKAVSIPSYVPVHILSHKSKVFKYYRACAYVHVKQRLRKP